MGSDKQAAGKAIQSSVQMGVVVVTDRRVIVHTRAAWSNSHQIVNLANVQDVTVYTHEFFSHRIGIQGMGTQMTIEIPRNKQAAAEIAQAIRGRHAANRHIENRQKEYVSNSTGTTLTVQLKELHDLHLAGALTEDEFSAAKVKMLGTN